MHGLCDRDGSMFVCKKLGQSDSESNHGRVMWNAKRERERERSLFAISLITSHITKSINGELPERKNSIIAGHL